MLNARYIPTKPALGFGSLTPAEGDTTKTDDPGTPFWDEHYGTWTNPTVDIYGYQETTGWSSQSAYQDYVSTINNYQTSTEFFENMSGNPGIPIPVTPAVHYAQNPRVAQKQRNCKTVFDAKMDAAQQAATAKLAAAAPLYVTAKIVAYRRYGQDGSRLPDIGLLVGLLWTIWEQESAEKVAQAEFKQCMYDAND